MWLAVSYLFFTLVMCKAMAAVIYGAVGFLLVRGLKVRPQMRVLAAVAVLVFSYPVSRMFEIFPTAGMLDAAGLLGADRVQSLQFRFDNEDLLLLKGSERLWFGWGGFNRERVYDPESAKDLVIQDGQWIAVFGTQGLMGFLCYFGLMLVPVVVAARQIKRVQRRSEQVMLAGFAFIVAMCSLNMLPNMQLPYMQFVFAMGLGVLMKELPKEGALTASKAESQAPEPSSHPSRPPRRGLQSAA
jgi:hypothetical protein